MTDDPLHDDATTAFFFQCGERDLYAVSHDQTGANIPLSGCPEGWLLRDTLRLGVREAVPAAIAPEPILRGIVADGYFIWSDGNTSRRMGRRNSGPSDARILVVWGRAECAALSDLWGARYSEPVTA